MSKSICLVLLWFFQHLVSDVSIGSQQTDFVRLKTSRMLSIQSSHSTQRYLASKMYPGQLISKLIICNRKGCHLDAFNEFSKFDV